MTDRELVNLSEAARRSGVPRTTLNNWVRNERLFAEGLDSDGARLYDLALVCSLAAATVRRRRACTTRR